MMRALIHILWVSCLLGKITGSYAEPIPEYDMKAAFLYNFAVFTEWPTALGKNLNLCILGTDSFGSSLEDINGKPVNGARLNIFRISNFRHINTCNMLFFGESERSDAQRIIEEIGDRPILTVTDANGLVEEGIIIGMQLVKNKLIFEVNAESSERTKLVLSSKLLRLARKIYNDKAEQ